MNKEVDTFFEVLKLGIEEAANSIRTLVDSPVQLSVPKCTVLDFEKLKTEVIPHFGFDFHHIGLQYSGFINGKTFLILQEEDALKMATVILGEENPSEEEIEDSGVLQEVGNIILNSLMACFGNTLKEALEYTVPERLKTSSEKFVDLLKTDLADKQIFFSTIKVLVPQKEISCVLSVMTTMDNIEAFVEKYNKR